MYIMYIMYIVYHVVSLRFHIKCDSCSNRVKSPILDENSLAFAPVILILFCR